MRIPDHHLLPVAAALASVLFLAGCHDNSDSSAPPVTTSSTVIEPEGGTARSADGLLTLVFPQGALDSEQTITITAIAPEDLGEEFDGIEVAQAYELGPDGQQFAVPVTVALLTNQNPVFDSDSLAVGLEFLLTSDGSQAVVLDNLGTVADGDAGTVVVTGELTHFSPLVKTTPIGEVSVDGMPDVITVSPEFFNILASVSSDIADLLSAKYTDASRFPLFEPYNFEPLIRQDARNLSKQFEYSCEEAASDVLYWGKFSLELSLFGPSRAGDVISVVLSKLVDCVEPAVPPPPEEPAGALTTGVFPVPGNLTGVENPFTMPIALLHEGGLVSDGRRALLAAGAEGTVVFDPETRDVLLDRTNMNTDPSTPFFGGVAVSQPNPGVQTPAALFAYGPGSFGGSLENYDTDSQSWPGSRQLISGSFTDAFPAGGEVISDEVLGCAGGQPKSIRFDAATNRYELDTDGSGIAVSFDVGRSCVSIVTSAPGGPVLSVSITQGNFTDSRLYFTDRTGDATEIGVLGVDARRVRHRGNVAAATLFADDALRLVAWDGQNTPAIVGDPVAVGDGPVDLDLFALTSGNTLIVSTGFSDNSVTLTEVDGGANLVSSTTYPAPGGCEAPAHAIFVPNPDVADAPFVIGTCFSSNNYFVATEQTLADGAP